MSASDEADIITQLFALRSQAGVIRARCEQERRLVIAMKCSQVQGACTEAIAELSKLNEHAEIKLP